MRLKRRQKRERLMSEEKIVTAAVLIIGNEILSGRTQDANLAYIAKGLNEVGVTLREARASHSRYRRGDDRCRRQRAARQFDYLLLPPPVASARRMTTIASGNASPRRSACSRWCIQAAMALPAILCAWRAQRSAHAHATTTPARRDVLVYNPVSRAPGQMRWRCLCLRAAVPRVMQGMFDTIKEGELSSRRTADDLRT